MKQFFNCILSFIIINITNTQAPDWVTNLGKSNKYSDLLYLTGFGMSKLDKDEDQAKCLQSALDAAKRNLVEKIRIRIEATSRSERTEANEKFVSYFNSAVQSSSNLEIEGLQTETYYEKSNEMGYGLAFVMRERLIEGSRKKAEGIRQSVRAHLSAGKKYENSNQRTQALNEYLASYPLFRQLEETVAIVSVAENEMAKAFQELQSANKTDEISITEVQQAADRLVQRQITSIDDIAWCIAFTLKNQVDLQKKNVMVVPFTYQDTKLGSPFSRFFKQSLEGQLVDLAKWIIVQQSTDFNPKTRGLLKEYAQASGAEYVLSGTYWELPDGIKFQSILRKVADGTILASTEKTVPLTVVRSSGLEVKPQNFKEAFADQKDFAADEVRDGGLSLEVWTNKGAENMLYTKGEHMQVYVRVNMPCYVRLIYHVADGKRTLLLDNYYMDASKVNLAYKLPDEFECDAPFGAEVLQAFARTEKFDPVETQEVDGYQVLTNDLHKILGTTRGMKKVKQGLLQTETRIAITTMEK